LLSNYGIDPEKIEYLRLSADMGHVRANASSSVVSV